MSEICWLSLKYMSQGVTANTRVFASTLTLYLFCSTYFRLSIKSRRVLSPQTFHFRSKRTGTPRANLNALQQRHTSCCCSDQNLNLSAVQPLSLPSTLSNSSHAVPPPLLPCSSCVELVASSCPVYWRSTMFAFWLHQSQNLAGYWLSSLRFFIIFLSLVRYSLRIIMQQTFEKLNLKIRGLRQRSG